MKPRIFISAVSREFKSTRQRIGDTLTRLGYEPVRQEVFGVESGDLRDVLRKKIDSCQGLIQIIGQSYGLEPPTIDPDFGRVSYTQFEFLYARRRGKKTWLILAGDDCTRDTSLEELDLPQRAAGNLEPASCQAELRKLQLDYLRRPEVGGGDHVLYEVGNDHELDLVIERLRDGLARLRVNPTLACIGLASALILILGFLWSINVTLKGEFISGQNGSSEELYRLLPDRYTRAREIFDNEANLIEGNALHSEFRGRFEAQLQVAEDAVNSRDEIRLHDATKELVKSILLLPDGVLSAQAKERLLANLGYEDSPEDPDSSPPEEGGAPSPPTGLRVLPP